MTTFISPNLEIKKLSPIKCSIILISLRLQEVPQSSLTPHQSRIPDRAMTKFHSEAPSDVTLLHRKILVVWNFDNAKNQGNRAINCGIRCDLVVLFQDDLARSVDRDRDAAPGDYPKRLCLNGPLICCRCHDLARRAEERG
jgi:hypothetical protein